MKDFAQLLKLPPSILSSIALATGLVLFLPQNILVKLGLNSIPPLWRTISGIAFIISASIVVIFILIKIATSIKYRINMLRFKWSFPQKMVKLRYEERIIVVLLYLSPNYTSRLPLTDGVTLRLQSKGMIQMTASSNITHGNNMSIPFTITPIAQKFLDNHPGFLKEFEKAKLQSLFDNMNDPFFT